MTATWLPPSRPALERGAPLDAYPRARRGGDAVRRGACPRRTRLEQSPFTAPRRVGPDDIPPVVRSRLVALLQPASSSPPMDSPPDCCRGGTTDGSAQRRGVRLRCPARRTSSVRAAGADGECQWIDRELVAHPR